YHLLHEAANLIHITTEVNETLVENARHPVEVAIQGLIDGVLEELERLPANKAVEAQITEALHKLLDTVKETTSIAHIAQARQAAEGAFDTALNVIEALENEEPEDETTHTTPSEPKIKKRRVIKAQDLWSNGFIETQEDIDACVKTLRHELEKALAANERVQIK
ncbi:hypothetical protein KKF84_10915, partial [Myxococcota bacterium]|nr:hypothetical protein [Myxococcota bacterium]